MIFCFSMYEGDADATWYSSQLFAGEAQPDSYRANIPSPKLRTRTPNIVTIIVPKNLCVGRQGKYSWKSEKILYLISKSSCPSANIYPALRKMGIMKLLLLLLFLALPGSYRPKDLLFSSTLVPAPLMVPTRNSRSMSMASKYYLKEVNGPLKDSSSFTISITQLDSLFARARQVGFSSV